MSLSFKQFTAFQAAAEQSDDEFLAHLEEGLFKSDDERVEEYKSLLASRDAKVRQDAERGLSLLVKKGNNKAKQLAAHMDKVKAQRNAEVDVKTKHAQTVNKPEDRSAKRTTGSYGTLGAHDFNPKGGFNWNRDEYRKN